MIDLTWKLFSQTGNIEAYLLLKELENDPYEKKLAQTESSDVVSFDAKM